MMQFFVLRQGLLVFHHHLKRERCGGGAKFHQSGLVKTARNDQRCAQHRAADTVVGTTERKRGMGMPMFWRGSPL